MTKPPDISSSKHTYTPEDLASLIGGKDINEFLYIIDEASKTQDHRIENFIRDYVAKDNQRHLIEAGYQPSCPKCGSVHVQKNGKRGEIQRYRCCDCSNRFTMFSGTILEKTNYTWSVWVKVVKSMLLGLSLAKTQRILADDLHCVRINTDTIWLMRMKVMEAISHLPSPVLSGVVQFDDTFFREDQKSSTTLVNPLPSDILREREPRYGRVPSKMGVRSSEFATVSTAIDSSGHCVCRLLAMGVVPVEVLYDFIRDNTSGISFACSDSDGNYKSVFADMRVSHYVRPSNYHDILEKAGYEKPSSKDKQIAAAQREKNAAVFERLWNDGLIDYIANRGDMTYLQFRQLKKANKLSLGRVNGLHDELKLELEKKTRGVSTKLLPFYLAWIEYVHNKRVGKGHALVSTKDAEEILIEAISAHSNITTADIDRIRKKPLSLPKPSGRYLHMLMRTTEMVRERTGNNRFYFGDEDGVETFNRKEIMSRMSDSQLARLARGVHIKSWRNKSRTSLISELMKKKDEGLDDVLYLIATGNAEERDFEPEPIDEDGEPYRYYISHHRDAKGLFTSKNMATPSHVKEPIYFLDCETTGLKFDRDEIVSIAIVSHDGEVLYDKLIKPSFRKSWTRSEKIHHITPKMVEDAPTIDEEKAEIERILSSAGCIVGWNVCFDLKMLYASGVDVLSDPRRRCDLMKAYCKWRRYEDESYTLAKDKLINATEYLGLFHNAHNALGDTVVLIDVWDKVAAKY